MLGHAGDHHASPRTSGVPVVSTIADVGAALVTVLALVVPLLAFAVIVAVVIWAVVVVRQLRRRRARAGQS
jgi:Flp pilus assembly protein TadB